MLSLYEQLDISTLDNEAIKVIINECVDSLKEYEALDSTHDNLFHETIDFLIKIGEQLPVETVPECKLVGYLWNATASSLIAATAMHSKLAKKITKCMQVLYEKELTKGSN